MILTLIDNGRSVTIGIGDVLSLRLSENPTTGYRWKLESLLGFKRAGCAGILSYFAVEAALHLQG